MHRVTISMWPDETRDVDSAELLDLQRQGLLIGDPVDLDELTAEERAALDKPAEVVDKPAEQGQPTTSALDIDRASQAKNKAATKPPATADDAPPAPDAGTAGPTKE